MYIVVFKCGLGKQYIHITLTVYGVYRTYRYYPENIIYFHKIVSVSVSCLLLWAHLAATPMVIPRMMIVNKWATQPPMMPPIPHFLAFWECLKDSSLSPLFQAVSLCIEYTHVQLDNKIAEREARANYNRATWFWPIANYVDIIILIIMSVTDVGWVPPEVLVSFVFAVW